MGVTLEPVGGWKNFEEHDRESLNYSDQTSNRNMDFEDTATEGQMQWWTMFLETGERESVLGSGCMFCNIIAAVITQKDLWVRNLLYLFFNCLITVSLGTVFSAVRFRTL